ncbi:hypothetical protein LTR85_009612 [Meristemomyces frigidus]|nr:hypothetical protein LTR85_009612 [Meristemomyces frigidus]
MQLLDLPTDLLVTLPFYLDSMNDLSSLIKTCRGLYITCHDTKAELHLHPHRQDGQYPMQPYPHLLIAGAARRVGDWAVQRIENRNALHSALMRGIDGLLELSYSVGRVDLAEMRRLHRIKYDVLIPLSEVAEFECTRSSGPLLSSASVCLLNRWIYSDLFHHAITASYRPVTVPAPLPTAMRIDYLRYCVPNYRGLRWVDVEEDARRRGEVTQISDLDVLLRSSTSFEHGSMRELLGYDDPFCYHQKGVNGNTAWTRDNNVAHVMQHQGLLTLCILRARLRAGDGRDEVADNAAVAALTPFADERADADLDQLKREIVQAHTDGLWGLPNTDATWLVSLFPHMGQASAQPLWRGLLDDMNTLRDQRASLGTP